jgi:hypothetical protein
MRHFKARAARTGGSAAIRRPQRFPAAREHGNLQR